MTLSREGRGGEERWGGPSALRFLPFEKREMKQIYQSVNNNYNLGGATQVSTLFVSVLS